jgi:hypothetical protein
MKSHTNTLESPARLLVTLLFAAIALLAVGTLAGCHSNEHSNNDPELGDTDDDTTFQSDDSPEEFGDEGGGVGM